MPIEDMSSEREEMNMNEYSINDMIKDGELYQKLFSSVRDGRLVPIIGSGFSSGLPARRGVVPTADKLKEYAVSLYGSLLGLNESELAEERKQTFTTSTTRFMNALRRVRGHRAKNAIADCQKYFDDNFTCVHGLSVAQTEFLKCGWQYLYTLNYDDAIEQVLSNYTQVLPNRKIDEDFLKTNRYCLIKPHGDAKTFAESGDIDCIILGKERYADSLFSDSNRLLVDWMKTDFSSKDLLLIGCGLEDEIDLLFARASSFEENASAASDNCSFYVMYDRNPSEELSYAMKSKLWDYGLENVIRLSPDDFDKFYLAIAKIGQEVEEARRYRPIESYVGTSVAVRSPNREADLPYLFSSSGLICGEGPVRSVLLPSFFVRREAARKIYGKLAAEKSICILFGRRFSGRTYLLLDLLQSYQSKGIKAYYFTNEEVTDRMFEEIEDMSDCVLIFDSETITGKQINHFFLRKLEKLRRNRVKVVCAVGKSDFQMLEVLLQDNLTSNEQCLLWELNPRLLESELRDFNERAKRLVLVDRTTKETFLDYAIRIESESLSRGSYAGLLKTTEAEMGRNKNLLICLIILAIKPWFDSAAASALGVEDEVRWLCESSMGVVQKEYISFDRQVWWNHSGAVYVVNSYYYIHKLLQQFASSADNFSFIAQAMRVIVQRLKNTNWRSLRDFRRRVRPFIYFDTLQEVFGMRTGSLRLCEFVYDSLTSLFVDDFQFLHQFAKCELRVARRLSRLSDILDKLEIARSYIDKASELANSYGGERKNITLAHMSFTKALILMNYLRIQGDEGLYFESNWVDLAIEEFFKAYAEDKDYVGLLTDRHEKIDIEWFISGLMDQGRLREFIGDGDHLHMAEAIISKFHSRKVRLLRGSNRMEEYLR